MLTGGEIFQPVFNVECHVCDHSPCVGIQRSSGLECTLLCGRCFFDDRAMLDYTLWNEQKESTE